MSGNEFGNQQDFIMRVNVHLAPLIAHFPVVWVDWINRLIGKIDYMYEANVKWPLTRSWITSIQVNSHRGYIDRSNWVFFGLFWAILYLKINTYLSNKGINYVLTKCGRRMWVLVAISIDINAYEAGTSFETNTDLKAFLLDVTACFLVLKAIRKTYQLLKVFYWILALINEESLLHLICFKTPCGKGHSPVFLWCSRTLQA